MRYKDEVPLLDTHKIIRGETEPKIISGTISWSNSGTPFLSVRWKADLNPPAGRMELSYQFDTPQEKGKNFFYSIPLRGRIINRIRTMGRKTIAKWTFSCPIQTHRSCFKRTFHLYLGENGIFGCPRCAKIARRENSQRDPSLDGIIKTPGKMASMLASPLVPMKKKLEIMSKANRLIARHKKAKIKLRKLQRKIRELEQMKGDSHAPVRPA